MNFMVIHENAAYEINYISANCLAIDAVYEGANGIREQIFVENCLQCHASNLVGAARDGAPFAVDFDTFEAAKINGPEAIEESVTKARMPPSYRDFSPLTDEQKAALLAWAGNGFPRYSSQATYDFATQLLTLPIVQVGNLNYRALLRLVPLNSSPLGFGFALQHAVASQDSSNTESVFDELSGVVTMPDVELLSGAAKGNDHVAAQMVLILDSDPLLFSLEAVE